MADQQPVDLDRLPFITHATMKEEKEPSPKSQMVGSWEKLFDYSVLMVPTIASSLLLASDCRGWELSGASSTFITQHRAAVQVAVQILSSALGLIQVQVMSNLVNSATRIWFTLAPVSLDTIALWTALSKATINWTLPARMVILTVLFGSLSTVLSAIWVGASTPVPSYQIHNATINVPGWSNSSLIAEYPSEIDRTGPSVRDARGYFTYSVGTGLLTSLVSSARTATPADGSVRQHAKLDTTGFTYFGRSYGVGAGVGLSDAVILSNPLATNYSFQETGYDASVSCIYNESSQFVLADNTGRDFLYSAVGALPDSDGKPESSVYVGHSDSAIVACGVSYFHDPAQPRRPRYLALAAGSYYANLNATQCVVTFEPARFNVSVRISDKRIAVQRMPVSAADIDPSGNLTHVAMRQIELISNDLTTLYRSTLGDAFNNSISDYAISAANLSQPIPLQNMTLMGLTNSVTSLVDDILGGYASAQLIVGNTSTSTTVAIQVQTQRLGERIYIISIAVINSVIVIVVAIEAIRTRGWEALLSFNYTDVRSVITSTSAGGSSIAALAALADQKRVGGIPVLLRMTQFTGSARPFKITLASTAAADIIRNQFGGMQTHRRAADQDYIAI